MRWPWQPAPVEHRSSYSDQVVTAILASAHGGGGRPALATAALETAAQLYAGALASCTITGPSGVVRALDASWRANVAGALIRHGQALFVIGADPVDGLTLRAAASFDVYGSADPPYSYRLERAGPSSSRWETRGSGEVLHLRWAVDFARPWRGVSPLQRAADTGSLAGWIEKRLAEEASGPVGSFLPVARFEPDADADLGADDADDPLAALRRDISAARGALLTVESQMAAADSAAQAPRRDYQVQRFGANPPEGIIELRDRIAGDVAQACGIPRGLILSTGSAQSARESWRQWVANGVDGLARRLEAQVLDQLGVEIAIDSSPLGARDLAGRAGAFAKLQKGGVAVPDARAAAGI